LGDKTLEEKFTGVKPTVGHMRIFGCLVYIHVPKEKRSKLEPSGKKGIFVCYSATSKAYQIYVPSHMFIEVNWDVTFHEEFSFHPSRETFIDAGLEEHEAPAVSSDCLDKTPSPDGQRCCCRLSLMPTSLLLVPDDNNSYVEPTVQLKHKIDCLIP
jgi:hypothetical protein